MKIFLATIFVLAGFSNAVFAEDLNTYRPDAYLKEKTLNGSNDQAQLLSVGETSVSVNRVRFRRFDTPDGAILVPYKDHLTQEDIEKHATCDENPAHAQSDAKIAQVESGTSNLKAYAGLIAQTIKVRCGPGNELDAPSKTKGHLDIGVSHKDPHKKDATEYKMFNRDLKPNVYFQADF